MARGIVIQITGDGESAKRALEMVQEQLKRTAEEAESSGSILEGAMERIKRVLEFEAIYEGIHRVVDGIKEMVGGSVELGVELGHLSQQTGISTENLSILKYASEVTGVGFETLTKSFRKFSVEILGAEEGKKQSIQTFQRLGISQQQVKEKGDDMLGMLGLVADRFKSLPEGPLKAAEAVALFGKSGMAMIPFLNQGKEGISKLEAEARSLGLVLSEEGVAKMEELHAATVRMDGAMRGAGLGITAGLTPALMGLAEALTVSTGTGNGMVDLGKQIGDAMLGAALDVAYLIKTLVQAKAEWDSISSHVDHPFDKLDAAVGFTQGQRDRGASRSAADEQRSRDAEASYKNAEAEYNRVADELAKSLSDTGGPTGPAESKSEHAKQEALKKQLRDIELQTQGSGSGGKPKSDDPIVRAAADLAAEQGKAMAAARRTVDEEAMAELEAQHKMGLVSDQYFYQEKLRLQNDELDAEEEALRTKGAQLQALYDQQRGDKLLKRDKNGNSAEELRTQKEMLQVQEQMAALEARRSHDSSANASEIDAGNRKAEIEGLKIAADLEKERNAGITAQIALIQREHEIEAQKVSNSGGSDSDAANVRAAGDLAVQKLRIAEVNRQIIETENMYADAVKRVNDAAEKNPALKAKAEQQINAINRQEAAQLQALVQQYDALAETLGGPFLEAARKLHLELDKLSTPSQKADAQFAKTLVDGVMKMGDTISEQAIKGKTSFKDMAKEMEADAVKLALKLAEMKILSHAGGGAGGAGGDGGPLASFFNKLLGGDSVPGYADGGQPTGLSMVGEEGPELFMPPVSGGTIIPAGLTQKLAEGGGGGNGGINVTSNVINQTSNPVQAQPSSVSYDSEMKQFIIHTILEDQAQGGPTSQISGG